VFEAAPNELNAGPMFVGGFESKTPAVLVARVFRAPFVDFAVPGRGTGP
jgi:hypothetical protein